MTLESRLPRRAETPEEFWLCSRANREAVVGVNMVERYRYERWRQTRNLVARAIRGADISGGSYGEA